MISFQKLFFNTVNGHFNSNLHITVSRPLRNQMKLKQTLMGPAQDEPLCLKDSK